MSSRMRIAAGLNRVWGSHIRSRKLFPARCNVSSLTALPSARNEAIKALSIGSLSISRLVLYLYIPTKTAQVSKTTKLLLKSRLQLLNESIFDFRGRTLCNTVGPRHLDKKPSIGSQQLPLNPIQNEHLILAQERALS